MADKSAIEWTEATWNPTTGCDRIRAGCDNCYALSLAKRLKAMGPRSTRTTATHVLRTRLRLSRVHADALDIPTRWREPRMVFVNSMSDLFHARVPIDYMREVFRGDGDTPRHTYQVLTKRAHGWRGSRTSSTGRRTCGWVSAWRRSRSSESIDLRARVPQRSDSSPQNHCSAPSTASTSTDIHWLIAGGESGPDHRPVDPEWVRGLRDACAKAGTAFFFKQWGGQDAEGGRPAAGRPDVGRDAIEGTYAGSMSVWSSLFLPFGLVLVASG